MVNQRTVGPYLSDILIVNETGDGGQVFQEALNSMTLFGADIHDEFNKGYYTIDLAPVLAANNSTKDVFVKFTDQSTEDGWGPGIFWMAVHSGAVELEGDAAVFSGLKAVNGEPMFNGVALLHRRYQTDASKVLSEIALPASSTLESSTVYLLGATLNPAQASAQPSLQWSLAADSLASHGPRARPASARVRPGGERTVDIRWRRDVGRRR